MYDDLERRHFEYDFLHTVKVLLYLKILPSPPSPTPPATLCVYCLRRTDKQNKKTQFQKWKILIACSWAGSWKIYDAERCLGAGVEDLSTKKINRSILCNKRFALYAVNFIFRLCRLLLPHLMAQD